jgi:uncharacterized membrane protein
VNPPVSRLEGIGLALVIAAGAALRFFRLTFQSLWFDELFSVVFSASGRSLAAIVETYAGDVHPLGYPVMLHIWLGIFGDTDLAARSLSAVWGVLGIAAMVLVGRRLGGPVLGLVVGALTAVNGYHIAYSQEARSYAVVFVLAALSYAALLSLVERPTAGRGLLFGLTIAAATHVHYWALVMLAGQVPAALVAWWRRGVPAREWAGPLAAAGAVVAVALAPWLGPFGRVAGMDRYWPTVPPPWFVVDYFHTWFGGSVVVAVLCAGLLAALPLLVRETTGGREAPGVLRRAAAVLGMSVVLSLAVAYARSVLVVPMLIPRFTLVLLPAVLLLVAVAVCRVPAATARAATVAVVVITSLTHLGLGGYYTTPRKQQWREATAAVVSDPRFDPTADVWLALYHQGFQYYALRMDAGVTIREATVGELRAALGSDPAPETVWLTTARGSQPPDEFRRVLREGYRRTDRSRFIAAEVERWQRRSTPASAGR